MRLSLIIHSTYEFVNYWEGFFYKFVNSFLCFFIQIAPVHVLLTVLVKEWYPVLGNGHLINLATIISLL